MRALQQAGFPTKKRFEDLLMDDLPQDGREAIPELKTLAFIKPSFRTNGLISKHFHDKLIGKIY